MLLHKAVLLQAVVILANIQIVQGFLKWKSIICAVCKHIAVFMSVLSSSSKDHLESLWWGREEGEGSAEQDPGN